MDIKQKFGLRIRDIRQQKGISQEGLAYIAEIDRTYVQSIESGKRNVSIITIEKLAKAFDMSIDNLLKNL